MTELRDGSAESGLPIRLISRLTTEFALMNLRRSLRLIPGRLETAVVAEALLRGGLRHMTVGNELALPTNRPLIGSINSVARSFKRSAETVRRHAQVLARQGFVSVDQDGVRLVASAETEAGQRILDHLRAAHDNLLWLVGELDGWGMIERRAGLAPASLERILRCSLDLRLLAYETFPLTLGGGTGAALWNALSAMSTRHITVNREPSAQFSWLSTPDSQRRPTSLRRLCAVSGLPFTTVWRKLAALEAMGQVGRKDDQYIMLTSQLRTDEMEARVVAYVQSALDRLNILVAEGIDPEAIPSLFMVCRPGLVDVA